MGFLDFFGIGSAVVTFFICLLNADSFASSFGSLVFAPLLFALFLVLFVTVNQKSRRSRSMTVRVTILIQWIRAVVLPFCAAFSDYYLDLPAQGDAGSSATLMYLYEHLAIYLLLFLLSMRDRQRASSNPVTEYHDGIQSSLHGNGVMYFLFFVFAVVLYFVFLRGQKIFSFIALDAEKDVVEAEEGNDSIALYIFLTAIIFLILNAVQKFSEKYKASGNKIWLVLAVSICLLRIALLTGAGRMGQVYICFGLGAVLMSLFPAHRKGILTTIITASAVAVVSVSIYKTFFVSTYGDYGLAVSRRDVDFKLIASQIDAYLAGPRMMSSNLSFVNESSIPYSTLFFDVFRNVFGVHYLFGRGRVGTVGLYNLWVYGGKKSGGYLFSGSVYSTLYFTPVLAPLSVVACLAFAYYFENKARKTRFSEWKYLHTLACSRLLMCGYIAFTGSLNIISRSFILFGLVIGLSHYLRIGSSRAPVMRQSSLHTEREPGLTENQIMERSLDKPS